MSLYSQRGVSAQKEEVHAAVKHLYQGLFPHAFCKVYPDFLANDDSFVNVMHADGAGTKSILAYLYWKETGDISVWRGIAQDAVVMNLDDLLCAGIHDNIVFNSTIDRNKNLIPGEVLSEIINGTQEVFDMLRGYGVHIHYLGGETADVGDVVRTVAVNGTMTARASKDNIIGNEKIAAGDVIVGMASFGLSSYEKKYNSGIGSNGLTSARHDVLEKYYADHFPESYDPSMPREVQYIGRHRLTESVSSSGTLHASGDQDLTIGELILSPTRTYAPVLKKLLTDHFDKIHGMIHCSGGGQTKCLKYLPGNFRVIKDNLFAPPEIFQIIRKGSGSAMREMYEVFNMGCRMEIYCPEAAAQVMIDAAKAHLIEARIIGRVEACEKKELIIRAEGEEAIFN